MQNGKPTSDKLFRIPRGITFVMVSVTVVLIILQFTVSVRYEPVAQMVGIMDFQSKTLNTTYLDYEEQNAILRSSKFLLSEKASGFVSGPSKVLYVNPGNAVISSNE